MTLHARPAVILWMVLLFVSVGVIANMTVTTDLTAFVPRSADRTQELLVGQLRDGVAARLILIGLEGAASETLAGSQPQGGSQSSGNRPLHFGEQWRSRRLHRGTRCGNASPVSLEFAITPEHFSTPALRAALQRQLQLLGLLAGAVMKASLPSDPTGEVAHILSELTTTDQPSRLQGVWFSRDDSRAQLVAETRAPGFDLDQQAKAVRAIQSAFAFRRLAGEQPAFIERPRRVCRRIPRGTIQRDSWRLSLVAAVLVTALLFTVYRSLPPLLLSLLPVFTGLLAGVAAVQLVFGFVHGITLGFGATLIGEAVDYPAYVLTQIKAGEQLQQTLLRVWPTLRLAVMTTVFGAVSMLLSKYHRPVSTGRPRVCGRIGGGVSGLADPPGIGAEDHANRPTSDSAYELDFIFDIRGPRPPDRMAVGALRHCDFDRPSSGHLG